MKNQGQTLEKGLYILYHVTMMRLKHHLLRKISPQKRLQTLNFVFIRARAYFLVPELNLRLPYAGELYNNITAQKTKFSGFLQ